MNIVIYGVIITALAAIATVGSWSTARAALQAQLLFQFIKEYSEPQMCTALQTLINWKSQYRDKFDTEYIKRLKKGEEKALEVHYARRQVSSYFSRAFRLYKTCFIRKRILQEIGAVEGINIYYDIVEKLEQKLNLEYDKKTFEQINKICGRIGSGGIISSVFDSSNCE